MLRVFGLLLAIGLALGAIGCTRETTVVDSGQQINGITVTGQASVFGEPDIALLTLGVDANAATVAEARTQAADSMTAMRDALTSGGVSEEDILTSRFSISPRYSTAQEPQIIGFTVSNLATVKIREIDSTGDLIDAAVGAGGDRARVEGLSFTIDDPTALEDQAREEAMANARSKAQALAEAGDVTLGTPRAINEGGGPIPVDFAGAELAFAQDDGGSRTQIDAGQLEVQISVTVVYELD
jgi:uncharacterized protein YggE